MPGVKPTETQYEQRVLTVVELLSRGLSRADVLRYVSEKTDWNVTERTVDNYIGRANERFAEYAELRRETEFGKAIKRVEYVYQAAMKVHDYQRALAALREINLLIGLYAPVKREYSVLIDMAPVLMKLVDTINGAGMNPADVFERMIQRIQQQQPVTSDERA